jgi:hypothetical protein
MLCCTITRSTAKLHDNKEICFESHNKRHDLRVLSFFIKEKKRGLKNMSSSLVYFGLLCVLGFTITG